MRCSRGILRSTEFKLNYHNSLINRFIFKIILPLLKIALFAKDLEAPSCNSIQTIPF